MLSRKINKSARFEYERAALQGSPEKVTRAFGVEATPCGVINTSRALVSHGQNNHLDVTDQPGQIIVRNVVQNYGCPLFTFGRG